MNDLISRQDALRPFCINTKGERIPERDCDNWQVQIPIAEVKKILKKIPAAEPQIVRCKDCKHWIPYDWMFSEVWQSKNMADYSEDEIGCNYCDMAMKSNDFCSRGERREVTT